MDIKQKIREIVEDVVEMEEFDDTSNFIGLYNIDSMMILELVSQLEKAFGIAIDEEDYGELQSVSDICTFIEKRAS